MRSLGRLNKRTETKGKNGEKRKEKERKGKKRKEKERKERGVAGREGLWSGGIRD